MTQISKEDCTDLPDFSMHLVSVSSVPNRCHQRFLDFFRNLFIALRTYSLDHPEVSIPSPLILFFYLFGFFNELQNRLDPRLGRRCECPLDLLERIMFVQEF